MLKTKVEVAVCGSALSVLLGFFSAISRLVPLGFAPWTANPQFLFLLFMASWRPSVSGVLRVLRFLSRFSFLPFLVFLSSLRRMLGRFLLGYLRGWVENILAPPVVISRFSRKSGFFLAAREKD